jgi:hypothetical protein
MCSSPDALTEGTWKSSTVMPYTHRSILQEAESLINGDRRASYGHPLDDYTRTAGLVNAAFADKLKEPLSPEDMMMVMVLVKLSRQRNLPKRDNLVDACGYLGCIELAEQKRNSEPK